MRTPYDWPAGVKSTVFATAVFIVILLYVTMCVGLVRIPVFFFK